MASIVTVKVRGRRTEQASSLRYVAVTSVAMSIMDLNGRDDVLGDQLVGFAESASVAFGMDGLRDERRRWSGEIASL